MRYFVELNGLICWVKENGESNHPVIAKNEQVSKVDGNKIIFLSSVGAIQDEFLLWDSLTSLAVSIEQAVNVDPDASLHIDTAVAMAHTKIEKFRSDWYNGHAINKEGYPLSIESNNTGIFFEQIAESLSSS